MILALILGPDESSKDSQSRIADRERDSPTRSALGTDTPNPIAQAAASEIFMAAAPRLKASRYRRLHFSRSLGTSFCYSNSLFISTSTQNLNR